MKKGKLIKRILMAVLFVFVAAICILSLFLYVDTKHSLDVESIVIKKGKFPLSKSKFNFSFHTRYSRKYNLVLTFVEDKAINANRSIDTMENHKVSVSVELEDNSGIVKNELKTEGYLEDYNDPGASHDLFLFSFDAVKGHIYHIKIEFKKVDKGYFDKRAKKLFIQKEYDPAARIWSEDLLLVFLVIFCISLFLTAFMIYFYIRRMLKKIKP